MRSETIQVTGVSKSYSKKQILNQIDFSTQPGQIYGMIGPSGSGKTTFIKMLVGMEKPDAGHVQVLNTAMPNLTILQQIGYMAQSDALYPTLTGKENLQFFAAIFKLSKSEQKERIAYTAQLVNLKEDLNKKVATYSGGMKRRLSLAIALIQNPEILILDEPTVTPSPHRLGVSFAILYFSTQAAQMQLLSFNSAGTRSFTCCGIFAVMHQQFCASATLQALLP